MAREAKKVGEKLTPPRDPASILRDKATLPPWSARQEATPRVSSKGQAWAVMGPQPRPLLPHERLGLFLPRGQAPVATGAV